MKNETQNEPKNVTQLTYKQDNLIIKQITKKCIIEWQSLITTSHASLWIVSHASITDGNHFNNFILRISTGTKTD